MIVKTSFLPTAVKSPFLSTTTTLLLSVCLSLLNPSVLAQTNVALGKPATQSSTNGAGNEASFAVDGDVTEAPGTAITSAQSNAWWTVKIAGVSEACSVTQVKVCLRTCCQGRANGAKVELWNDDPTYTCSSQVVTAATMDATNPQVFTFSATGVRCVRIFRASYEHLEFTEVEVYGECFTNIACLKPAAQSADPYGAYAAADKGVDGNRNPNWSGASIFHTQGGPGDWWRVELSSNPDCCIDNVVVWNEMDGSTERERLVDDVVQLWNTDPQLGGTPLAISSRLTDAGSQSLSFGGVTGVRCVRLFQERVRNLNVAEVEVFGACGPGSAGAGGDPHFKLFSGQSFDFHGHCDLLLLESPSVAGGAGLSVQVRSSPYKEIFLYISEAAVQIGNAVLTVGAGGQHAINGVPQVVGETASLVVDKAHVFPVQSSATWKGRRVYKIHLGDGPDGKEELIIREFKNWITVTFFHPSASNLGSSRGLLGHFPDGAMLGRDGKTIHTSYDAFGQDWQVPPGESLLGPGPFSDSCVPLQAQKRRLRRLEEASIAREQAMTVCKHWGDQMEDCINDVQISGDLEMANAGPV